MLVYIHMQTFPMSDATKQNRLHLSSKHQYLCLTCVHVFRVERMNGSSKLRLYTNICHQSETTANTGYHKRFQMVEVLLTIWHSTAVRFWKCNYMVFSLAASDDYIPSTELKQDSQSQGRKERWIHFFLKCLWGNRTRCCSRVFLYYHSKVISSWLTKWNNCTNSLFMKFSWVMPMLRCSVQSYKRYRLVLMYTVSTMFITAYYFD